MNSYVRNCLGLPGKQVDVRVAREIHRLRITNVVWRLICLVAAFLHQARRSRPAIDVGMQSRVASDFNMDPKQAKSLIRDIQFSSSHSFLVATYRSGSPMFMWESIDSKLSLSHISLHKHGLRSLQY